jgi:hypothetical protein
MKGFSRGNRCRPISVAVVTALALGLAGCISNQISPASALAAPRQFVYAPALPEGVERATATFTRDTGGPPGANGNRWLIYLDGKPVARIGKGETFTVDVPTGEHILGIEPDAAIKILQVMNISQMFTAGRHYYFRAQFTQNEFRLQPTVPEGDVR